MVSLRDAMDRLFEDSFVSRRGYPAGWNGDSLALDVYENEESLVVTSSLPGVKPEDLEITITGDVLTIRGETKSEEKVEKANYLRQERRFGSFQRSVQIPGALQSDKAEASFENGVLTLTIPKAEEARPKTIKVEAKK
jgi:HSP20 family protein